MTDPRDRPRKARQRPFRIVNEDVHLIVADKDAGILTVPIPGKRSRNLKDLLDRYLVSQKRRALPVHRIDRYTSGLVVFAKSRAAWQNLVHQFRGRTPERTYLALVRGRVEPEAGTLRHRLELTADGFRQRVVTRGGTEAVTHYRVAEHLRAATLLEVRLESGLKNQIRVQFRAVGHPLVGDRHYAEEEAREARLQRQALHAWKLSFLHPVTGRPVSFEAPLARDMGALVARLRSPSNRPPGTAQEDDAR
ncbi:MAG: RluA family pseudouridine synthase [Deferrisomatales bacterium]|nr:RluA family pseudouridine synthase [Deferrisomatales bacterium]